MTNGAHIREEELALLAAGALPEEECAALRAHAAECEECGARLAEERGRAALLAFAAEQERPAATIKAELFARIRAEREAEHRYQWPVRPGAEESAKETQEAKRALSRRPGWWSWVLVPVAGALLLATLVEWRENQRLHAELEDTNRQVMEMAIQRQHTEMVLEVLSAPDTLSVKMGGTPETEMATGMVRYNARKGVVLYTAALPQLPAGKTYQMWLVPAVGAPINAGVFAPTEQKQRWWTGIVPVNTEVKAFAVTVEPAGGVPQPTGPKVLLGSIGG